MQPSIKLNLLAVLVAAIASFFVGGCWYGPLFGKTWAKLMNFPADFKPERKQMIGAYGGQLVGLLLMAYVMAFIVQVWRPSVWIPLAPDKSDATYALNAAFFSWLGFIVPLQLGRIGWENKPPTLVAIDAGYWLLALLAQALILSAWR